MRKKIAVILSRIPYPLDKGDKLRAYHQLRYLSQFFDLYVFCLSTSRPKTQHLDHIRSFCKEVEVHRLSPLDILKGCIFSIQQQYPVQVGYFFSETAKKKIEARILSLDVDAVYCQLSRTALYGKDLPFRKVIDFQDAFSLNYKRIAVELSGLKKKFYKREQRTMKEFELKMLDWFDEATIISAYDSRQVMAGHPKWHVIPNGVDTDYFHPQHKKPSYDMLFVGNLSYLPNKQAVFFLHNRVLPIILKKRPSTRIRIVGADTPRDIRRLNNKNFIVSGFLPDVRDAYNDTRLMVVPLFTGAGMQNKVLEAMSMELCCLTTSIVNKSIGAQGGAELVIAENPMEFAEKTLILLDEPGLKRSISEHARLFVQKTYNWETSNAKLKELF